MHGWFSRHEAACMRCVHAGHAPHADSARHAARAQTACCAPFAQHTHSACCTYTSWHTSACSDRAWGCWRPASGVLMGLRCWSHAQSCCDCGSYAAGTAHAATHLAKKCLLALRGHTALVPLDVGTPLDVVCCVHGWLGMLRLPKRLQQERLMLWPAANTA